MMKRVHPCFRIGVVPLLGLLMLALSGGCGQAGREVICVMMNPATGQKVEMHKEFWYKVPANYDEKQQIERWKAAQRKKGFTVEVRDGRPVGLPNETHPVTRASESPPPPNHP